MAYNLCNHPTQSTPESGFFFNSIECLIMFSVSFVVYYCNGSIKCFTAKYLGLYIKIDENYEMFKVFAAVLR